MRIKRIWLYVRYARLVVEIVAIALLDALWHSSSGRKLKRIVFGSRPRQVDTITDCHLSHRTILIGQRQFDKE
jgi:hypothetical protein